MHRFVWAGAILPMLLQAVEFVGHLFGVHLGVGPF